MKKKQWIQLIVILMACSFLFILAGCNSSCMDECAVSDCDSDMSAQGISIPGICYDSHKCMAGSLNIPDDEDDEDTYFISCDSVDEEDGCLGCKNGYVLIGGESIDSWGCTFGTVDEESDNEESWVGCANGSVETKNTDGAAMMMIKLMELGLDIY